MACATLKRSLEVDALQTPHRPTKRRRCAPLGTSPSILPSRESTLSPFDTMIPRITNEAINASVREEMKRLYRRKQLHFGNSSGAVTFPSKSPLLPLLPKLAEASNNVTVTSSSASTSSSIISAIKSSSPESKDKPLFTFKQVGLIVERMLRERETELREIYEQALATKLDEQYDTFVKFTYDQIQKRFENSAAPSYLS